MAWTSPTWDRWNNRGSGPPSSTSPNSQPDSIYEPYTGPGWAPGPGTPAPSAPSGSGSPAQQAAQAPDGSGAPSNILGVSAGPAGDAIDYYAMAKALYPWIPDDLLRIFSDAWAQYGDPEVALGVMRQSPVYDQHFAGNRRPDGSFRLSEQEYFATVDGYRQAWAAYDINPELMASRFVSLIEGDVSVNEFSGRLSQAYNELINFGPEGVDGRSYAQQYYADIYGVQLNDPATFLSFIDPEMGQDILNRRVSVSQVGGGALAYGFNRSEARVQRLVGMGLSGDNAARFYAGAAAQLPLAQSLARRFNNRQDVGIGTLEDAGILGDAVQQRRLEGNVRSEVVSFNRRTTGARDQQGRVFGLEQQ